jgi:hypothetical protein
MSSEQDRDYSYEQLVPDSLDLFNTGTESSTAESASFGLLDDQSEGDNLFDFGFSTGLTGASTLNSFANGLVEGNLQCLADTDNLSQFQFPQADDISSSARSNLVTPAQNSAFSIGSFASYLGPADATINPRALDISGRDLYQHQQDSDNLASLNPPARQSWSLSAIQASRSFGASPGDVAEKTLYNGPMNVSFFF